MTFLRAGKSLDEMIQGSLKQDLDKRLVLASKDDLACHILERLQSESRRSRVTVPHLTGISSSAF